MGWNLRPVSAYYMSGIAIPSTAKVALAEPQKQSFVRYDEYTRHAVQPEHTTLRQTSTSHDRHAAAFKMLT